MADINSTNSSFGSEYDSTKSTSGTSYTGGAYGSSTTPRETENSFSKTEGAEDHDLLGDAQEMLGEGFDKAISFVQSNWKMILGVTAVVAAGGILISRKVLSKNWPSQNRRKKRHCELSEQSKSKNSFGRTQFSSLIFNL